MSELTVHPQTNHRARPALLLALILLLAGLLFAVPAGLAVAQDEPFSENVVTATTTANLNMRDAPGLDGEILANLPFGTVVGFTGLTDITGDWVQVDAADGPVGWVWGAFLSNVPDDLTVWMADETAGEMEEEDAGEEPFSDDVVTATTTANLNMRDAPGLDGEILTNLPFGTVVGFSGLTDITGGWVQVDAADGPVGWVWDAYLSNVPDDLTVWNPDETAAEMEDEDTGEEPFSDDVVTATTTANLNMRDAPSLDGEILTNLPFGTVVGFTGLTDETGSWVQVDASGGPVGWVWGAFLSNVPADLTVWTGE